MAVPVYLFTGFLDSGKTKFMQETLEDPRFNTGENTLLLVCEEGEEEYDQKKMHCGNVAVEVIEHESDLTPEHLAALLTRADADRVMVEYNGMWLLRSLINGMPDDWTIYQEMMFCDARTFLSYNANMRQLVADKLAGCEMVVFNRADSSVDRAAFHSIVRSVTRAASIVYEDPMGNAEYDDIEDPLPFDVDAPIIEIKDEDYAIWYYDLTDKMDEYNGKTVRFKGRVATGKGLPNGCFAVGRHIMTCCAEDVQFTALICNWPEEMRAKEWVTVTAKISVQFHKSYKRRGPVLNAISVEPAQPPAQEVCQLY